MRAAASRTFCTAGRSRPIKMAMIAITTSNSISVKPAFRLVWTILMIAISVTSVASWARFPGAVQVKRRQVVGTLFNMGREWRGLGLAVQGRHLIDEWFALHEELPSICRHPDDDHLVIARRGAVFQRVR